MKKFFLMLAVMFTSLAVSAQVVFEQDYTKWDSFPYYVMGYTPTFDAENGLISEGTGWYQYFIADGIKTEVGESYDATFVIKGSRNTSFNANMGWGWGDGQQRGTSLAVTTEWQTVTITFENIGGTSCNIVVQPNNVNLMVRSLKVKKHTSVDTSSDPIATEDGVIDITGSLTVRELDKKDVSYEKDATVSATSAVGASDDHSTQFFIGLTKYATTGTKLEVSFDYKASMAAKAATQAHGTNPGDYQHWACIGDVNFTTEWQTFKTTITVSEQMSGANGMKNIAFNLNIDKENAITFDFKNVKVTTPIVKMDATLEVGDAKWATFYAPFGCDLAQAGVQGYYVAGVQNGVLELTECPYADAYQPVIVFSESPVSVKLNAEVEATRDSKGLLVGTLKSISAPEGSYVLQNQSKVGFYKVGEGTVTRVKANRAYLKVPASNVKAFYLDDEAATAIEQLTSASEKTIYDLSGRKLNKLQKGINIVNGVKVLVK